MDAFLVKTDNIPASTLCNKHCAIINLPPSSIIWLNSWLDMVFANNFPCRGLSAWVRCFPRLLLLLRLWSETFQGSMYHGQCLDQPISGRIYLEESQCKRTTLTKNFISFDSSSFSDVSDTISTGHRPWTLAAVRAFRPGFMFSSDTFLLRKTPPTRRWHLFLIDVRPAIAFVTSTSTWFFTIHHG